MNTLRRRLARLEESAKPAGCECKGPVLYDDEEPVCCPIHGYLTGYIILPRVLTVEEWQARYSPSKQSN